MGAARRHRRRGPRRRGDRTRRGIGRPAGARDGGSGDDNEPGGDGGRGAQLVCAGPDHTGTPDDYRKSLYGAHRGQEGNVYELTAEERAALIRHGYDPDLPPRGVSGGPERVRVTYAQEPGPSGGWPGWPYLRNHVCKLDGVLIDGHEFSDLDAVGPGASCIQCGLEFDDFTDIDRGY